MLLSAIAFGVPVDMTKVHIEGITHLEAKDIKFAEELGYRIKLLGITKYTDYGIELRVHPALVPTRRLLANVEGAMNAVVVKGDAAESSLYYGKGAGSEPTGSAVVADLIDIARTAEVAVSERPRMPTTTHNPKAKSFADFGDTVCSYYLRIPVEDKPGVLAEIARILADNKISIESLIQKEAPLEDASTEIILLKHSTLNIYVDGELQFTKSESLDGGQRTFNLQGSYGARVEIEGELGEVSQRQTVKADKAKTVRMNFNDKTDTTVPDGTD